MPFIKSTQFAADKIYNGLIKSNSFEITFDDWIFKQDDKVAINRAIMTKFGIKVAELTVFFQKD